MNLKKYLITGMLIWLPILAGVWTINYIVSASNILIKWLPAMWQPKEILGFDIPGLGVILAILILFFTGLLGANVLGRRVVRMWDRFFEHIPVVKTVYSSVKKVSESLLSDSRQSFKTPLLVRFPHAEVWSIAFVSGSVPQKLSAALPGEEEYLSVYVPTTPNPTGGYYILVRKSDTRDIDLSVDEALKYIISLGMVVSDEASTQQNLPKNSSTESIQK